MTFRGHIEQGRVIFDEQVTLPEGAVVQVSLAPSQARRTIADRFRDVIGTASDLPEDLAQQHDHYLHGTPKQ
jgi:hypothetical protein